MKLHSSLTTVTPVTKALALFLFIAIPIITFFVGIKIGTDTAPYPRCCLSSSIDKITPTPSPDTINTPTTIDDSSTTDIINSTSPEILSPDSKFSVRSSINWTGSFIEVIDKSNPTKTYYEYPTEFTHFDTHHLVNFFWLNNTEILVSKVSGFIDNTLYRIRIDSVNKTASIEYFHDIEPVSDQYVDFGEYNPSKTKFYIYQNCITCAPQGSRIKVLDTKYNLLFEKLYGGGPEIDDGTYVKRWVNNNQIELETTNYDDEVGKLVTTEIINV